MSNRRPPQFWIDWADALTGNVITLTSLGLMTWAPLLALVFHPSRFLLPLQTGLIAFGSGVVFFCLTGCAQETRRTAKVAKAALQEPDPIVFEHLQKKKKILFWFWYCARAGSLVTAP